MKYHVITWLTEDDPDGYYTFATLDLAIGFSSGFSVGASEYAGSALAIVAHGDDWLEELEDTEREAAALEMLALAVAQEGV